MSKSLFLHVGMPKCATTTVQEFLRENRLNLEKQGFLYPDFNSPKPNGQGNGAYLSHCFLKKKQSDVDAYIDEIVNAPGNVIISTEQFIGLRFSKMMRQFIGQLAEAGIETYVIIYFRRQDLWIESDFKQHIKGGSDWTGSIQELIEKREKSKALNYFGILKAWDKAVGQDNVKPVLMNPGQPPEFALSAFLEILGLSPDAFDLTVPRENKSPPTGLIEPARMLKQQWQNQGFKVLDIHSKLRRFFDWSAEKGNAPKRRFLLPYDTRQAIVDRFTPLNERMYEKYNLADRFGDEVRPDQSDVARIERREKLIVQEYLGLRPVTFVDKLYSKARYLIRGNA